MSNNLFDNTFFGQAWARGRRLFAVCVLLLLCWFVPLVTGFEISPFYDWSMYALPQLPHDTFEVAEIRLEGSRSYRPPAALLDHRRMLITYSLPHYADMQARHDTGTYPTKTARIMHAIFQPEGKRRLHNTGAALAAYPEWLRRYVYRQTGRRVTGVIQHRVVYDKAFRPRSVGSRILF